MIKRLLRALHSRTGKKTLAGEARALLGLKPGQRIPCEHRWSEPWASSFAEVGVVRCEDCYLAFFVKGEQRLTYDQAKKAGWFEAD
jgi:hypothetical protein